MAKFELVEVKSLKDNLFVKSRERSKFSSKTTFFKAGEKVTLPNNVLRNLKEGVDYDLPKAKKAEEKPPENPPKPDGTGNLVK